MAGSNDVVPNLRGIIAHASIFHGLSDKQLDTIVAHTTSHRLARETRVLSKGELADGMYWIVYGQVKLGLHSKPGGDKTLEILGQGKCFGLAEMLLGRPHLADIKVLTDAMLLYTERAAMLEVAAQNFEFAQAMMTRLGRQFYGLVRDIESYSQSARQRLAGYLLRQSARETSKDIVLVANRGMIASRLSLTPETLSRLLHELRDEGAIAVSARRIQILDQALLEAAHESAPPALAEGAAESCA